MMSGDAGTLTRIPFKYTNSKQKRQEKNGKTAFNYRRDNA